MISFDLVLKLRGMIQHFGSRMSKIILKLVEMLVIKYLISFRNRLD
jgi:hypothetical protein